MLELLNAYHFLTFVHDERFRQAVAHHTDLGPVMAAPDIGERSTALRTRLEEQWDDVRSEVDALMRRWCDGLAVPPGRPRDELSDHLVFVLDRGAPHGLRNDEALLHEVVVDDDEATRGRATDVSAEIRRIVPRDLWASAYLLLAPDDAPGADSTTEASLLHGLCVRAGVWRLHRLLVDPAAIPPRGSAAADAIRAALDLPPRAGTGR